MHYVSTTSVTILPKTLPGLYIPRMLPFIPGNEHRNRDAVSVIRVWQTRGVGRWLMETTCL
jgi:hypothetical protein